MATKKPRGNFAMLSRAVGHAGVAQVFEVRVMAVAEKYAMVRRKGAAPFIVPLEQLAGYEPNRPKRGPQAECALIVSLIDAVENRCMAVDGPVTPTHQEITDEELRKIYRAAKRGARA